jgi:hypothetical protein
MNLNFTPLTGALDKAFWLAAAGVRSLADRRRLILAVGLAWPGWAPGRC